MGNGVSDLGKRESHHEEQRRQAKHYLSITSAGQIGDGFGGGVGFTPYKPDRNSKMTKGDWLALAGLGILLAFLIFSLF